MTSHFFTVAMAVFCLLAASAMAQPETDESFLLKNLPGNWKENQYERENLNNFLYEMGMNWFKRVYVTSSSWENEQRITIENNKVNIDGIKGPRRVEDHYFMWLDNFTRSEIDLGEVGGLNDATAEVKGLVMTAYLRQKGTEDITITSTRTMSRDNPNKMVYVTNHLPSGVSMTSYYYRQP